MAKLTRALQTKVATRVALLFLTSAMLPLAGLALLTSLRVSAALDEQGETGLADDAKSLAMDGLGQLALFTDRLRLFGANLTARSGNTAAAADRVHELFTSPPEALTWFPDDADPVEFGAPVERPRLTPAQQSQLDRTGQVVALGTAGGVTRSLLMVSNGAGHDAGLVAATVDPRRIFGIEGDAAFLPAATEVCILPPAGRRECSDGMWPGVAQQVVPGMAIGTTLVDDAGERFVVHARTVPLHASYGADEWTVVIVRPQSVLREPLRPFLRDFWIVAFLAGLVVTWITLYQVRRQMRPLDALMAGTRRLAQRDFTQRLTLRSRDEFEDLGHAFNDLSERLRDQFAELDAFNLGTLAALARTIDAKSPWTAGHSERVTKLAIAIAREMQLPEAELLAISRGGLVHDIGKLATPPEILDKPGPLTAEEFDVMREHPEKGVHILEPVPAFRPLLPIVGQHHERWDGSGYPLGLIGTAIARTARVLAVADVCDAMSSDRPYRPGMERAQVIELIAGGAGTQFDPDVVEAFLRIYK